MAPETEKKFRKIKLLFTGANSQVVRRYFRDKYGQMLATDVFYNPRCPAQVPGIEGASES